MKTVLISTPPQPPCHPIDIDEPNWRERFRQFIQKRVGIAFPLRVMEVILELEPELDAAGYEHQILLTDCHCHFLVRNHQ